MYLQSLEISGFKSFATRTLVEFHRGVTAVVGPNGCGKSNVLDAIRWVLGEQSAKALRGGEMADVIFSGTDSRQPLGMAEVSLTFSECEQELGVEWNEVRITRRVFRDGKGEYLINRTPCRLRDIHHLFMDTGIGRSAYSIMEQGKIDQILSSKPEDRRAIFEEAAGITKYKSQKKEALRKLDYTEANLLRVSDIIKEVKRQIGSLQRQAGKARRYQALLESLRTFDTHLSHRKFSKFADELETIREDLTKLEDSKKGQEEQIVTQEQELENHRSQLGSIDAEISQIRDAAQTLRNRVVSAESRIESHQHRQTEFEELIGRNESDIVAARAKTEEQESQIQQTDRQIEELINTLRVGEEALSVQDAKLQAVRSERQDIEQSLTQTQQEASRLEGELGRVRSEMATANAQTEAAEARLAMLHGEYSGAQAAQEEMNTRASDHDSRLSSLTSQLEEARAQSAQFQERLETLNSSKQAIESEATQLDRKLTELRSRLEILRQLEAAGEGLGEATQSLLRGLDNPDFFQSSVLGALANLINVDPHYVPAVEAALGSVLQGVVFKDPSVAESALLTLAKGENGRGAVLARGWMPQEQNAFSATPDTLPAECLAWAASVIQAQPEISQFLNTFLKHVVIVSDLEKAIALRQSHPRLSFVTLGGDLLTRDGIAYSGNAKNGASSALLRKTEISNLSTELDEFTQKHAAVQARLQTATQEQEEVNTSLTEARQRQQDLQLELSTAQQEQLLFQRQCEDAAKRLAHFQQEIDLLNKQSESNRSQTSELESRISEISSRQEAATSQRQEFENKMHELRARESEAGEELNELRIRVATERQQNDNLQRQREPMRARLEELAELVVQRGNDIENYRSRIAQFTAEAVELQSNIESWTSEQKETEDQGHALLDRRNEVQSGVETLDADLRNSRKLITDLQERGSRLEVRTTQVELKMENISEHAQRRYSLNLHEFEPDHYTLHKAIKEHKLDIATDSTSPDPESDAEQLAGDTFTDSTSELPTAQPAQENEIPWDAIADTVEELSGRLDSIGPVNLDAIQEFEELEQRYAFLEQQNTDLINSKAELLDVIAKINTTTRELFSDTFEKIRQNFQEMFTELFGGGKANLVLSDESDPLESGIEIIAKPPGKQLQSVTLLSGGERTMTAVSLLFSIYMVKPSPFCVLDEMDAPLDESNISRFVKILDRFVGQSQFVVITHNKRTIGRADMLYGVTMEEHGVSKLVGVKFRGKDNDAAALTEGKSIAESFDKSGDLHSEQKEAEKEKEEATLV